jgi:sulfite exporter TauE/SafE
VISVFAETGKLFLTGLAAGAGPCLATCAPLVLPLVAGTAKNGRQGLGLTLSFFAGRLAVYIGLGALAGWSLRSLSWFTENPALQNNMLRAGAGFILFLGALIVMGKDISSPWCRSWHKYFVDKSHGSMFILGILAGLAPCLPLLGVLTYTAFKARDPLQGALWGGSFGLGTMLSPLLIAGVALGAARGHWPAQKTVQQIFVKGSGILLIVWGLFLLLHK